MSIKAAVKSDWHTKDGGEDDRGVTEDHRDDKADKQRMYRRVVLRTCVQCAEIQINDPADPKPDESAKETGGNIARERIGVANIAPGKVVPQEPK